MNIVKKIRNTVTLVIVKWVIAILLPVVFLIGSYVYHDYNIYIKNLIIFLIVIIDMYILSTTHIGKSLIIFGKEACCELQKVVWPTYQDTLNTTLIVIAVTVMISLILWGLDTVLVKVISYALRF